MQALSVALGRLIALCALCAVCDALILGARLREALRLIAAALMMGAVMDMSRAFVAALTGGV